MDTNYNEEKAASRALLGIQQVFNYPTLLPSFAYELKIHLNVLLPSSKIPDPTLLRRLEDPQEVIAKDGGAGHIHVCIRGPVGRTCQRRKGFCDSLPSLLSRRKGGSGRTHLIPCYPGSKCHKLSGHPIGFH